MVPQHTVARGGWWRLAAARPRYSSLIGQYPRLPILAGGAVRPSRVGSSGESSASAIHAAWPERWVLLGVQHTSPIDHAM